MISNKKLHSIKTIVTHENCADGIASAILLHDAIPDAEVVFMQYGTKLHRELEAKEGMIFCDISPHADRVKEFVDAGAIILDHHKSAEPIVKAFGDNGVFADEVEEPGVSGARLAFREVWTLYGSTFDCIQSPPPVLAYDFARLIGVRDTWQSKDPEWHLACEHSEAIRFFPVESWLSIADPFGSGHDQLKQQLSLGGLLITKHQAAVEGALRRAWRITTAKGTRVAIFQGISLTSDAVEALADTADLVIGFGYEVEDNWHKIILSTRSHTTYNCAELAKHYGGGGHTKAAGFSIKFLYEDAFASPNPYLHALGLVEQFEKQAK